MPASYTGDPISSPLDAVRLEIGDTDTDHALLQDGEILYCLQQEAGVLAASARACEQIQALYARQCDRAVGDLKLTASQRSEQYRRKALDLRSRASRQVEVFAGGLSESEKAQARQDTDLVQPSFWRGQMDNPAATPFDPPLPQSGWPL